MRKRRGGLAKVVTVFLALLVALVLIGMGYGIWSDTLNISGTVEMGTVSAVLSTGSCAPSGDVTCGATTTHIEPPNPDRIAVTILNPVANGDYYCDYVITNTGTVPVKVKAIDIYYGNLPGGSTVDPGMVVGQQIAPGPGAAGTVHAQLPGTGVNEQIDYVFYVTFVVGW